MGLPCDKMSVTVDKYGNTSGIDTAQHGLKVKRNRIKPGDNIVLVGFEVWFNMGSVYLTWGTSEDLTPKRRVVITGAGALTPIGNTAKETCRMH